MRNWNEKEESVKMRVYWPNKKMVFAAYFRSEELAKQQMELHFAKYRRLKGFE